MDGSTSSLAAHLHLFVFLTSPTVSEPLLTPSSLLPMSTSSPVKRTKPAPSRQAHENSSTIKKTPQPEDFLTRHLSPVPKDLQWENSIDLSLLPKSKKANPEHLEKLEYQPFSKFLNMLSHCVRSE